MADVLYEEMDVCPYCESTRFMGRFVADAWYDERIVYYCYSCDSFFDFPTTIWVEIA